MRERKTPFLWSSSYTTFEFHIVQQMLHSLHPREPPRDEKRFVQVLIFHSYPMTVSRLFSLTNSFKVIFFSLLLNRYNSNSMKGFAEFKWKPLRKTSTETQPHCSIEIRLLNSVLPPSLQDGSIYYISTIKMEPLAVSTIYALSIK